MQCVQTTQSRRFLLALTDAPSLVVALKSLARDHAVVAGCFSGRGTSEGGDDGVGGAMPSLSALTVSGHFVDEGSDFVVRMTIMGAASTLPSPVLMYQPEDLTGVTMSLTLSSVDDVAVELDGDLFRPVSALQEGVVTAGGDLGWAELARLSSAQDDEVAQSDVQAPKKASRRVNTTELFDEPIPEVGDYVDHRQFGLCRVDGESGDDGLIIRQPSGVRKVIRLEVMQVLPPRMEGDKRIYPVRPRKRR